ncbi:hypothetical protein H2198_004124 [Neophaeococcomyces mojaviensis]|uniref:Uncharacterized protein n=1 Tax=Neophaeococcomyces mojaviensis TaxID=3383035 RepID=A0ACC3A9C4_9EURO|nr:hypothetical protein H2198_004124 [Knufia sp. JES_112]
MLRQIFLAFAAVPALRLFSHAATLPIHERDTSTGPSCTNTTFLSVALASSLPGVSIISILAREQKNVTVPATPPFSAVDVSGLNFCDVEVVLTHAGMNDMVRVAVWLPLVGSDSTWNGRFLGTGGSGWAPGLFDYNLAPAVKLGYAAASTDAGLVDPSLGYTNPLSPASWALTPSGGVNIPLLTNFASRSIHDMAVVGKAVAAAYYSKPANHSYFNGCSTGGRQGLAEAQTYPTDFNGIVAGAPAINWAHYVVAETWPQVVMHDKNLFPSDCELDAFTAAAIAACDKLDGVEDGVITRPDQCTFDPSALIGTSIQCPSSDGKQNITTIITADVANIVQQIWSGPYNWYGLEKSASLDYLANTTVSKAGKPVGAPFFVSDTWTQYFLAKNPNFDTSSVNTNEFFTLFNQSVTQYDSIIGTSNPDLSAFHSSGGKLLVWHGLADQLIFPQGTVDYFHRVLAQSSNQPHQDTDLDSFFRLFLAPGVDHCGGGTTPGAIPVDPLSAVVKWVEQGIPPDVLDAASADGKLKREVCKYPLVPVYRGQGDANDAASWTCEPDTTWQEWL